jgi:predicted transcriptional regulator
MKRTLSKRKKAVLEVMSKPKIPAEIREQTGLKRNNNISSILKELLDLSLICCLNPRTRVGKLYGLTIRGKRQRKKLLNEKGTTYSYIQPSDMNWDLYGWVICGKQKKAILKAIKMAMSLKYIREQAQEYNPRISRMNCNDILQLFVKKGIARKIKHRNHVNFILTKTGEKIREQLIEP